MEELPKQETSTLEKKTRALEKAIQIMSENSAAIKVALELGGGNSSSEEVYSALSNHPDYILLKALRAEVDKLEQHK